jgi:uncharacterized protein
VGVAHLVLLWNGDILALYAAAGLVALVFIGRSQRTLVVAIAIIALVSSLPYSGRSAVAAGRDLPLAIEQALQIYSRGTYAEIIAFRLHETVRQMLPLYMIQLPRTVGLFLLGILVYRLGIFQRPGDHRRLLRTVLAVGAAVGIAGTTLRVRLAPVGRMALSNYLLQSLVLGFVFYGYGLGLFGRLASAEALPVALTLYAAQIVASAVWLRHFRFGPAEWLWRCATYGRWQPMSRTAPSLRPVAAPD